MKAYIFITDTNEGERWELIDASIENAIMTFAGKQKLKLVWEKDNILYETTIRPKSDVDFLAQRIAIKLLEKLKEKL